MAEEKNINDQYPDHVPVITTDIEIERQKNEIRELAKKMREEYGTPEPIVVTKNGQVKKASKLNIEEQEDEFIKCATDPIYFIETYLTIFDQTQGESGLIVPFKLFEFQKHIIKEYLENRFNIANKYRQAGITTTTCAYVSWYVMFNKNRGVAIVANKLETAKDEIMADVVDFINNCPEYIKPKTGKLSEKNLKDTQKLKRYDNGSSIGAFSAKGGLRGYTPTLLFWDETAWTEKGDKFWEASGPTLQTGGRAIFVSCVTKDTFLYTNKGIKQMKDFIPNEELGAHIIDDYYVLGKDKLRKGNLFFNNGYVDTLKVKTTFTELESSHNHKYWAYKVKDNKYGIYKTSELEIGDYISIQHGINVWGNNDDCSDFKPIISKNAKNIFKPKKITPDLAYFIGLYISEGYMFNMIRNGKKHTTQITLTCGDSLTGVFDKIGFKYYFDGIHYTISSKSMGDFFEYLGFDLSKKAKEKIIPSRLFEMSKKNIIAMIQGIMDGDGWSSFNKNKNKLRVGIRLSSKELIDQLRILFGNFGILTEYQESITPPTKKVKVSSKGHTITANNSFAIKYLNEIGFRFERKQIKETYFDCVKQKHSGVVDNIPNGKEITNKIYNEIKSYGKLKELRKNGIILDHCTKDEDCIALPSSRKTLLKLIELEKNNISEKLLNEIKPIISNNLYWTKIKSIEQSKNWTYDFSLPNDSPEENDFHHSVAYNQILGFQTPSGLDPIFYKTFMLAKSKENNFNAIEIYWFNDPRYNSRLEWCKNKNKENEIRVADVDWPEEQRIKMMEDGWEATSPWFEEQIKQANGDLRKINQELRGSFLGSGDNFIAETYLSRIQEKEIKAPIKQEYVDREFWIFEDPIAGEDYVMGIDASAGHSEDFSTINILKVKEIIEEKLVTKNGLTKKIKQRRNTSEQVAEYYAKLTPQLLAEVAYQFGKRYNDAYAVVDITGGYGVQTVEKLFEFGYENVHYSEITHKPSRDRLQGYIKKGTKTLGDGSVIEVDLIPGFFIGNNRASVLLETQRAIHMEDIIIRSVRLLSELKTYINVAGSRVADHKRSFHDDSIMGLAIALYTITFDMKRFAHSAEKTKKLLDVMININDKQNLDRIKLEQLNQPRVSPNSTHGMNPYISNGWLFKGLKQK